MIDKLKIKKKSAQSSIWDIGLETFRKIIYRLHDKYMCIMKKA